MDIVLLPGLWLPMEVWDPTADALIAAGHHVRLVSLPGVDDADAGATLDDQLAAVLDVVDRLTRPLVVGHSAASNLAWLVADRRPTDIAGVALVGGFPSPTGAVYADFFPVVDGVMAFPGWEPFAGPDSDDLDDAARAAIETMAVPVAGGVAEAEMSLTDDRRYDVPTVVVCPEYGPDDAKEWIASGGIPELAAARNVSFVDLETGHWPMVSRPAEFAAVLASIAVDLGTP